MKNNCLLLLWSVYRLGTTVAVWSLWTAWSLLTASICEETFYSIFLYIHPPIITCIKHFIYQLWHVFFSTTGLTCLRWPRSFSMVRADSAFVLFLKLWVQIWTGAGLLGFYITQRYQSVFTGLRSTVLLHMLEKSTVKYFVTHREAACNLINDVLYHFFDICSSTPQDLESYFNV